MTSHLIDFTPAPGRAHFTHFVGERVAVVVFDQRMLMQVQEGLMERWVVPAGIDHRGMADLVGREFGRIVLDHGHPFLLFGEWSMGAGVVRDGGVHCGTTHFSLCTWGPVAAAEAMQRLLRARYNAEVMAQWRELLAQRKHAGVEDPVVDDVPFDYVMARLKEVDAEVAMLCRKT